MKRLLATLFLLCVSAAFGAGSDYYSHGTFPVQGSAATSAGMRSELDLIMAGFGKLPALNAGHGNYVVVKNSGDTGVTDVASVPVAQGGTGATTLTGFLFGAGTSAVTAVAGIGSGNVVRATSPTLVTPTLGAALATSINGNTFTSGTYTLTGTAGKTLNFTNTLTLSGTDSTTMTFPSTSATIARTDAANTFTGHQTVEGVTSTGATGTGKFVFDTSPTIATPTISSPTITGSAVTFTTGSGSVRTIANAAEIIVCTTTCTVTPPATLTAGMQFCVQNDDNISTVITLAASTNIQYEAQARTSYGTANHTMTSGGAVKDQVCFVAISTTKYNMFSATGTWTLN